MKVAGGLWSRMVRVLPVALAAAVALGGCGDLPGAPAPQPTRPIATSAYEVPVPADWPEESAQPLESGLPAVAGQPLGTVPASTPSPNPRTSCEGGPFGCRTFTSVSGGDSSGELEWLKAKPLVVSMIFVNGTWSVRVQTPCNSMGMNVTVKGNQLVPGDSISTAMACLGPESGYESWTQELFGQTMTWELTGESLVLQNSHGTVKLKDSGPDPSG